MATAAGTIQGTPQVATNAAPTASQPESTNYLQRCVLDLNPDVAATHDSNAFLWDIASKATLVVFTILATGTFVAVGLFAPIYLPVVSIGSILLMNPAFQLHQKLSLYSAQTQRRAEQLRDIAQEHSALPDDARMTGMKLALMRIQWNRIPGVQQVEDLNQFKPLIARYEYWRKQQESYESEMNTHSQEASQLLNPSSTQTPAATTDGPSLQDRVNVLRMEALQAQENALICKANAAFVHAVIQRPEFAGSFGDLAEFNESTLQERALAQRFGDPAADHFIQFRNRDIQPITLTEIRDNTAMPTHMLAQRFVQAIAAAAA